MNITASHIKHKLVAKFICISVFKMICPIGMSAIQIAVGIYHFRLNPNTEIHSEFIYIIYQFINPIWKLFFINIPIAKPCPVIISFAEPSVIHNKKFNTDIRCQFGKGCLLRYIYIKFSCFPRIIKHRKRLIIKTFRKKKIN